MEPNVKYVARDKVQGTATFGVYILRLPYARPFSGHLRDCRVSTTPSFELHGRDKVLPISVHADAVRTDRFGVATDCFGRLGPMLGFL